MRVFPFLPRFRACVPTCAGPCVRDGFFLYRNMYDFKFKFRRPYSTLACCGLERIKMDRFLVPKKHIKITTHVDTHRLTQIQHTEALMG